MKARDALLIGAVGLSILSVGSLAAAQDEEAEPEGTEEVADEESAVDDGVPAEENVADEAGDEPAADEPAADDPAADDPTGPSGKEEDAALVADAEAGNSPIELPGKAYHFVGLRYRGIIVPKFMQNLFGDGGRTVYVHAIGPEYINRKDGFEYGLSIWNAWYSLEPTPFKAKDDPVEAWEIVESKIKVLFVSADFLWSNEFTPEFALNYGLGAGLGIVYGDLIREQAKPSNGNTGQDPYDWVPCSGPSDPASTCDADENDHFNGYTEPSWAGGGSKPVVFPWFTIQTGLRYKPHRNFVARLDVGFGTSGFFFGIGADYGL